MTWQHTCWPKDKHEEILELVRKANDGALPDWAIAADLVYHADAANHPRKPKPFPGRRWFEKRWNVSERTARNALADAGWQEKLDALGIPRPMRELKGANVPVAVPPASPLASPSLSPSRTNEPGQLAENVPVTVPVAVPPASPLLSTRAEIPPLLLSSSPPEEEEQQHVGRATDEGAGEGPKDEPPVAARALRDAHAAAYGEAAAYFGKVVHERIGRRPSRGPDRSSKLGQRLYTAIKRDASKVMDAMRFVAEGEGERAEKLRAYDGLTVETVLNHLDTYADLYRAERDRREDARWAQMRVHVDRGLAALSPAEVRARIAASDKPDDYKAAAIAYIDSIEYRGAAK